MTYSHAVRDRLVRLVGDGRSGGGINLSLLFATLLDRLQDDGKLTVSSGLKAIEVPLGNQYSRIQHLYSGSGSAGDAMAHFMTDCMEHLEYQRITEREGNAWVPGPGFRLGNRMVVIGTFGGRRIDIGHTVLPREERERVGEQRDLPSRIREDIARLAQLLHPTAMGLRPIRQSTIDFLRDSVERWGVQEEFPVLRDQHGRILSGRHRLEVARQLGIVWPESRIEVRDDRHAMEIAMAANCSRPLTSDEFKRLEGSGLGSTQRESMRHLVELALLENPSRSDLTITKLVGCDDDTTVAAVRRGLEETSEIPRVRFEGGRELASRRQRPPKAIGGQMKELVDLITAEGGLTVDELVGLTGMPRNSVSANCSNAVKIGLLVRTADKRPMSNGSKKASVYRSTAPASV
jgi:hypothetical protein